MGCDFFNVLSIIRLLITQAGWKQKGLILIITANYLVGDYRQKEFILGS